MLKHNLITFIGAAALTLAGTAHAAGGAARGKTLYESRCTGCHDTSIHTRPDSIIHSHGALVRRIKFCESMAKAGWSEQQFDDVAAYLNQSFYKFKQ